MAKKCLPGVFCIENMTLFLLFVMILILAFVFYQLKANNQQSSTENPKIIVVSTPALPTHEHGSINPLLSVSTRGDPFNDPYAPPLKSDGYFFRTDSSDIRAVPPVGIMPVNIPPRGFRTGYTQMGILTRTNGRNNDMILPLMGRRSASNNNKYQYYTISNTGNMNTKLPVSSNGKSCTGEYGCDEINNNDVVYVEGYKDTFIATIYENNSFSYIPYI